jgi:dihydroflavonol-4-reductase
VIEGLKPGKETVVLVTGAGGWVGAHVAKALLDSGYSVRAAVSKLASERVDFLRDMGCSLVAVPDLGEDEGWAVAMAGCAGFAHVTLNPEPRTLNPQPSTLNPEPSTR